MTFVPWDRRVQSGAAAARRAEQFSAEIVRRVVRFFAVAACRGRRNAAGSAYAAEQFCPKDRRNRAGTGYRVGLASSAGTSLPQKWFMKLRENGSDLKSFV